MNRAVVPLFAWAWLSVALASEVPISEDSLLVEIDDTIATTYLNPFGGAGTAAIDTNFNAVVNQNLPMKRMAEPDPTEVARTMMANPGKTQAPIVLTLAHANSGAQSREPEAILDSAGATPFREARVEGQSAGEPVLAPRGTRAEIPLAERFVTRSLDRNTAIIVLYVDGGGPSQFDWSQEELENTAEGMVNMLVDVLNMAHSYGIDMTFHYVPSYMQIESEPILNGSGIYYGSADAWEEGDLDPWRSEVIGNVEWIGGQRYAPNLRGFFDYIGDVSNYTECSQVATIFVINSDTVKYHITGQPPDWAAGWDFNYRFSKPYCTVERTGTTMNEANFRYVAMHELFHLFGAADEYDGSSDCVDQANCGSI